MFGKIIEKLPKFKKLVVEIRKDTWSANVPVPKLNISIVISF